MSEHPLEQIFHPRAIAVVGVPSQGTSGRIGDFLGSLKAAGYHEQHGLYPVNPKTEEVAGLRCYPTLPDCPDPVDHVIPQRPARGGPRCRRARGGPPAPGGASGRAVPRPGPGWPS